MRYPNVLKVLLLVVPTVVLSKTSRKLVQTDPMLLVPPPAITEQTVTVCLPVEIPTDGSNDCNNAMNFASSPSLGIKFHCIGGGTVQGCLKMVQDGVAQLTKVPGSGELLAKNEYGFEPLVSEYFNNALGNSTQGYAVALVNSDWCYTTHEGKPQMEDLQELKGCFSGYSSDGGWFAPVGSLMKYGNMTIVSEKMDVSDDAESVLGYFSEVCAPGKYQTAPSTNGWQYKKLCSLCQDDKDCTSSNPWYGQDGVLECGRKDGDVVFMEYPILDTDVGAGNMLSTMAQSPETQIAETVVPQDEQKADNPKNAENENSNKDNGKNNNKDNGKNNNKDNGKNKKNDNKHNKNKKDTNNNNFDQTVVEANSPSLNELLLAPVSGIDLTGRKLKRSIAQVPNVQNELMANKLLFCPTESQPCQPLSNYESCNFGKIPTQAFVSTKDFANSELGGMTRRLLVAAGYSSEFMNAASKVGNAPYWLISPGTTALQAISDSPFPFDPKFADSVGMSIKYATNMAAEVSQQQQSGEGQSSEGGGLSTAAIIGISVGAAIGTATLLAFGFIFFSKRKQKAGWRQYQDAVKSINRI